MKRSTFVRLACAGGAAIALLASGCGTLPYGTDPYGYGYNDPYGSGYSDPYGSGYGSGYSDPYGSGYGSGYGTGSSYNGTPPGIYSPPPSIVVGELKVGSIKKETKGILFWKKMTVTGQVTNPSQGILTGELTISFMKRNKVVETSSEFVTDLAPGQSHSFTVTSKKSADDVQISVTSQQGTAAPATGYGTGSGYGSGYGSDPYGSGYGSSYGSGYSDPYGGSTGYGSTY